MDKNLNDLNRTSVDQADQKDSFAKRAGDTIERLGDKVSRAGATKVGQAIHDLGDKIEHSRDGK